MPRRVTLGISIGWIPLAFLYDGVTVLMLPVALAAEGNGASLIGLVSFAGLATAVAIQPLAGRLGDLLRGTLDRRTVLALWALPALLGLWLFAGAASLLVVAAGYLVLQVGASGMQAAIQAFIPEHVERDRHGRAAGLRTAFDIGGGFLAFLALGTAISGAGLGSAATLTCAVVVASLVVVVLLVPRQATGRVPAGVRSAWALPPGLARLMVARFLFLLGTYGVGRFLLLLVGQRLGIDVASATDEAGALLAALTLATAVTAPALGRLADHGRRESLMLGGAVVSTLGIAALLPDAGLGGLLAGGLLMSLGTAAFMTGNWAATTNLVPPGEAGRLMGIANVGTGAAAASAGLFGPLIGWFGFAVALVGAAVATAAATLPLVQRRTRGVVESM